MASRELSREIRALDGAETLVHVCEDKTSYVVERYGMYGPSLADYVRHDATPWVKVNRGEHCPWCFKSFERIRDELIGICRRFHGEA